MKNLFRLCPVALIAMSVPALAQDMTPAPAATAAATVPIASPLTEAEQKTLDRCTKMDPQQQAQSSKCSKVMAKAGKQDPNKIQKPMSPGDVR